MALALALSLGSAAIGAQEVTRASQPQLAQFVERLGGRHAIGDLLGRRKGALTDAIRNAIADSLVAIAVSDDSRDVPGMLKLDAVSLLAASGMVPPTERFSGAPSRLLIIAEHAPDAGIRDIAVVGIALLEDRAESLPMLRRIASSSTPEAATAVAVLAGRLGPEGKTVLQDLFRQKAVTEAHAIKVPTWWAKKFEWIPWI